MKALLPILLFVIALRANAQTLPDLHTSSGPLPTGEEIGAVFPLGDLTGDGLDDYAIRFDQRFVPSVFSPHTDLVSGADGTTVRTLFSTAIATEFVMDVEACGDLNGDGISEIALTLTYFPGILTSVVVAPRVRVLDGATGVMAWEATMGPALSVAGRLTRTVGLSDLDGDGVRDLACLLTGTSGFGFAPQFSATISWLSGADGSLIHEVVDYLDIVTTIANAGDTNADGFDDLLVTAPWSPVGGPNTGAASLISGATFGYLKHWTGTAPGQLFGVAGAGIGDFDGDGHGDVAVAVYQTSEILLYSGCDHALIQTIPNVVLGMGGGHKVLSLPGFDWNGDGVTDLFVLRQSPDRTFVYSGADGVLLALLENGYIVGDLNGDGGLDYAQWEPINGIPSTFSILFNRVHQGAEPYGGGTGGLGLSWDASSAMPAFGHVVLAGGTPFGSALVVSSLAPTQGLVPGTSLPLLVSLAPADVFRQEMVTLDAMGGHRAWASLRQPAIAGTTLNLQWLEISANPAVSNGLQILFDS